jgi:low affinity Fe/Cu permease
MDSKNTSFFTRFSSFTAKMAGKPFTFILATLTIIVWAITGPVFKYSDTWQLVINTGTTIITFLMVFLIQNTQNRDSVALQLKLDELINATTKARNELMEIEDMDEKTLMERKKEMIKLAHTADAVGELDENEA